MKKLLLSVIIICIAFILFAQQTGSDVEILGMVDKEANPEELLGLAKTYVKTDSLKALKYSREAVKIAEGKSNNELLAAGYYSMAETYYYFDEYSSAEFYYTKSLDVYHLINDSTNMAECYNSIGLVNYYKGEYNISIERLLMALKLFEEVGNMDEEAHVYSNIAMVYGRIKDYEMAASHYQKASEINLAINDTGSLSVNYNGLGVTFYNMEQYDSSKVYYSKALELFRLMGNQYREAIALNNIANIYVNSGDSLEQAKNYYEQAFAVFRDLKDFRNEAFVLEGLGSVYRELGDFTEALLVFDRCLKLVDDHKIGYYLKQLVYQDISITYEKMGRVNDAYKAFKLYSQYNDSLLREERVNQVAELSKKYEVEKKEAEIDRLSALQKVNELKIQQNRHIRVFGGILIILLILIVIIVSIGYFDKKKTNHLLSLKNTQIESQKVQLEKIDASKNKFFSIIAHDLKNPFHTVMGYSYLMHREYKRFKDEERIKFAEDIYKSTNSIFRLLENLLDWSRSQTGRINYSPREFNFNDLHENIMGLMKPVAEAKSMQLISEIEPSAVAFADPMMVETILRNLINNAIKFTNEDGWVKTIARIDDGILRICIEDNGIGIKPTDLEKLFRIDSKVKSKGTQNEDGSGLGLILCKEFVEKNRGKIWVESTLGEGSKFYFTLPTQRNSYEG